MRARNALCEKGFSFEYSATFAQAVKGNQTLTNLYAKSILCDYSYRYFYGDGFGKDYQILNLDQGTQQNHLEVYLTACLLSFFQLVTTTGKNLFAGRFEYLNTIGLTPAQVFDETLATLFNAPAGGQLYIENLKSATGEVALRLGAENEPFGVINVGDDAKLVKLCEEHGLETSASEFAGSLFHTIGTSQSPIHLLIGSKKFTEGWSSWRVSTMGLMNVGKGEGAQIIQLFGRGVGFFEAGNFHPDFILWLLIGNQQRVLFVDPKGIRNLGPTDPKIRFYEEVKKIERRLGDPNVRLKSFIVSNTPSHTMRRLWNMRKTDIQNRHILFQEEDQDTYIRTMFEHAR